MIPKSNSCCTPKTSLFVLERTPPHPNQTGITTSIYATFCDAVTFDNQSLTTDMLASRLMHHGWARPCSITQLVSSPPPPSNILSLANRPGITMVLMAAKSAKEYCTSLLLFKLHSVTQRKKITVIAASASSPHRLFQGGRRGRWARRTRHQYLPVDYRQGHTLPQFERYCLFAASKRRTERSP